MASGCLVFLIEKCAHNSSLTSSNIPSFLLLLFLGPNSLPLYVITSEFTSYLVESSFLPHLCYVWSHLLWWIMGNRYEYSSIDIAQSYIFGIDYHWLRNSICMGIYLVVPYVLIVWEVYRKYVALEAKNQIL